MQTSSILMQTLCVPCACRCRYCLLSWDGHTAGADWDRSVRFARGFQDWLKQNRPDLSFSFSFGYSMEHPDLKGALRTLREIGSPQASYLQCDGLRMRTEEECKEFAGMLRAEGVQALNFTIYGERAYHDRFAGRCGDFDLLLRLMNAAGREGMEISAGVPLTADNLSQVSELIPFLESLPAAPHIFLFIPHGEGRGAKLQPFRLKEEAFLALPDHVRALLNRSLFRPEREWIEGGFYQEETQRTLILSLQAQCMARYEAMTPADLIREAEELDDAYYRAFPPFQELALRYGDPESTLLYRQRDLYHYYRRQYAAEFGVEVYDVTDERQTGSRRF